MVASYNFIDLEGNPGAVSASLMFSCMYHGHSWPTQISQSPCSHWASLPQARRWWPDFWGSFLQVSSWLIPGHWNWSVYWLANHCADFLSNQLQKIPISHHPLHLPLPTFASAPPCNLRVTFLVFVLQQWNYGSNMLYLYRCLQGTMFSWIRQIDRQLSPFRGLLDFLSGMPVPCLDSTWLALLWWNSD